MEWFSLKAKPLPEKLRGTKAAQLRLSKGIPPEIWGGREPMSVCMSERHGTARYDVEVTFLRASKESNLIDAETDESKAELGKLGADMLAGNAYRVAGQNPVGNPASVAAVKSCMHLGQAAYQGEDKPKNEAKLRQVAFVSYELKCAFQKYMVKANMVAGVDKTMSETHIPGILEEEDLLRAEIAAFTGSIIEVTIVMTEPYSFPDPYRGSEYVLANFKL